MNARFCVLAQANTVVGISKDSHDANMALFVVNTPHLRVAQPWTLHTLIDSMAIDIGYSAMVRYLARKPWEGWQIPLDALIESHCEYKISQA